MSEPEVDPIGVLVPLGPGQDVSVHSVGGTGEYERRVVLSCDAGPLTLRLSASPAAMLNLGREIVRLAEDAL